MFVLSESLFILAEVSIFLETEGFDSITWGTTWKQADFGLVKQGFDISKVLLSF